MSTPIHFNYKGTEYTSLEAMPLEVRAEYEKRLQIKSQILRGLEQAQHGAHQAVSGLEKVERGADQAMSSQAAATPATPTWGGTRPAGAVQVPQTLDPVTNLGRVGAAGGGLAVVG